MTQTRQPAPGIAEIIPTPRSLVATTRELLARSVELPGSKRELLAVLSEYRAALFAFAVENDKPCWGRRIRPEQLTRATGLAAARIDAACAGVPALTGRADVLRRQPAISCEVTRARQALRATPTRTQNLLGSPGTSAGESGRHCGM
jgi:hypothetical protein